MADRSMNLKGYLHPPKAVGGMSPMSKPPMMAGAKPVAAAVVMKPPKMGPKAPPIMPSVPQVAPQVGMAGILGTPPGVASAAPRMRKPRMGKSAVMPGVAKMNAWMGGGQ
jgi:hypothetical protein